MKKKWIYGLILLLMALVASCGLSRSKPEQIFAKIGLNANKIPRNFTQHFKEIRGHKANGSLTIVTKKNQVKKGVTATEYVQHNYPNMFAADIQGIKELATDEESQPIIDAGLNLFQYADDIYKNDFPRIAKMIDEGQPDEEINEAIEVLNNSKGTALEDKYNKVMELLLPYADKYGVQYKVNNYPF